MGEAFAANRDGSLIVGGHCDPRIRRCDSAWTWTAAGRRAMLPRHAPAALPNLPCNTVMLSTSDNGRVIGGAFTFGLDSEALLWLDGEAFFLKDYLRANGYPDAFRGLGQHRFVTRRLA